MYLWFIGQLRKRLILELQESFSRHPVYRKIVPDIVNNFSSKARPLYGIVVKSDGGSKVQFSADNYTGETNSYVMLSYIDYPQHPIEWIREDYRKVKSHGGMPTPPGIYFLEITKAPTVEGELGEFHIDPLLTRNDEPVLLFQSGVELEGQLQELPAANTVRLYVNGRVFLKEGVDYTVDYTTGKISFTRWYGPGVKILADYRYAQPSIGPVPFMWNSSNFTTLPGVVMAFGNRSEDKQKVAIVVYQDRVQATKNYGGKFNGNFSLIVTARDLNQLDEIAAHAFYCLLQEKRDLLASEGISIMDVSIGGETEEPLNESGADKLFTTTLSVQIEADWEAQHPMPLMISRATTMSSEDPETAVSLLEPKKPSFFDTYLVRVGRKDDFERLT